MTIAAINCRQNRRSPWSIVGFGDGATRVDAIGMQGEWRNIDDSDVTVCVDCSHANESDCPVLARSSSNEAQSRQPDVRIRFRLFVLDSCPLRAIKHVQGEKNLHRLACVITPNLARGNESGIPGTALPEGSCSPRVNQGLPSAARLPGRQGPPCHLDFMADPAAFAPQRPPPGCFLPQGR